jgi:hypothetical protein
VLIVLLCGAVLPVPAAQAQSAPQRLVTFVARQCDRYTDIAANRARNDIQESLADLGVDSAYKGGTPVSPSVEDAQSPSCRPLPGWKFTLGTGYQTRAEVGDWGSLSHVTGPYAAPAIQTQASIPLLDRNGDPTGATIAGAVTVALTSRQAQAAATANSLWVQGGVPGDPVLGGLFPGAYGFGALRCGIDALNGDNVEWIGYPTGARHVFCYAYYVTPPPRSGTIVVTKQLDAPPGSATQAFRFQGDISYTNDHAFTLTAGPGRPASATFYRAGGQTWSFREDALPGYGVERLTCASAAGTSGADTDAGTGATAVHLAAGDTVTCTYVNGLRVPPDVSPPAVVAPAAGLIVAKRTIGATGTFPFAVEGPEDRSVTLTTDAEEAVAAAPPLALAAGRYTIGETLPEPTGAGSWALTSAVCDGAERPVQQPLAVDLEPGQGSSCIFTNTFTPSGSIVVRKVTDGGTGQVGFLIRPSAGDRPDSYVQTATTTREDVAATATGDDTGALPLGSYDIIETNPTTAGGGWTLDAVVCDGRPVGAAQGRAVVTLTRDQPAADCTFIDHFTRGTEPENPSAPPPATAPGQVVGAAAANGPTAALSITKSVRPRIARPGQRIVYRIVVTNRGPDTAYDVVGTEIGLTARKPISVRPSRGTCTQQRPVRCRVGAIRPGTRVVVTAVTTAPTAPGPAPNRVAVVTSTSERRLDDNRASATVVVRRPAGPPPVTG